MKQAWRVLLIIVLAAGLAIVQGQSMTASAGKAAQAGVEEMLKQIERDWVDAVKAKNAQKLGDILADGWTGIDWDGQTSDKAKALGDLKSAGSSVDSIELGPMKVRLLGNVAIVTGSDTEKSMTKGKDTSGKYVWTDVFVNQNGKWRAIASQSTKVST